MNKINKMAPGPKRICQLTPGQLTAPKLQGARGLLWEKEGEIWILPNLAATDIWTVAAALPIRV